MKYLGIDWGLKKIGIAIGDSETKVASPLFILPFHSIKQLGEKLKSIIVEDEIDELIVGEPTSLAGNKTDNVEYRKFLDFLSKFKLKIHLEDERMSTKLAQRLEHDQKGRAKGQDDDTAAAVLLQNFLDKMR